MEMQLEHSSRFSSGLELASDILFKGSLESYRAGVCRDRIMHDLILADAARLGEHLIFLDIGCGKGFDTDIPLQQSLVNAAGTYIGIEPDSSVSPIDEIADCRRCLFEEADLPSNSIHVAFAIMVLEHLGKPQLFWDRLLDVLVPGGVFWAMTVDARHWFSFASLWSERLRLKELYLSWLLGKRGFTRYENYPVYYRCNTPQQIERYAKHFSSVTCFNLSRIGQSDGLLPGFLRPVSRAMESLFIQRGWSGSLLFVRAVK